MSRNNMFKVWDSILEIEVEDDGYIYGLFKHIDVLIRKKDPKSTMWDEAPRHYKGIWL